MYTLIFGPNGIFQNIIFILLISIPFLSTQPGVYLVTYPPPHLKKLSIYNSTWRFQMDSLTFSFKIIMSFLFLKDILAESYSFSVLKILLLINHLPLSFGHSVVFCHSPIKDFFQLSLRNWHNTSSFTESVIIDCAGWHHQNETSPDSSSIPPLRPSFVCVCVRAYSQII